MRKAKIFAGIGILLFAALYYYIELPAINIHARGLWSFLITLVVILLVLYVIRGIRKRTFFLGNLTETRQQIKSSKVLSMGITAVLVLVVVYLIGSVLSSPIVNASKYQKLLEVSEGDFAKDVKGMSFSQIPRLDRDSATLLGNRKMGSLVEMVSQYEVDSIYTRINYQNRPVRVSPLKYANLIKWFTNSKEGIPAFIMIDMATQNTSLVRLDEGIKYSTSDHFGRNIYRHLRFSYPTYIFQDLSFEIDEEGTPYWICPVSEFKIGLFGGETVGRVVTCNAITGETKDYAVEDCPQWVDRAYSADLLVSHYNYYGTLKHGFFNSVLGQKDCLQTTEGYNYLAIDDDIWVYTGVTSVSGDQSNVGFVLMNQRTKEAKYYKVEGATETSAMASAEGEVQNLKYQATFPLLLNIGDQPTYFMALKDDAGLVKKYAMVNVQKYQWVAIGNTVDECIADYQDLLLSNGIVENELPPVKDTYTAEGKIASITEVVVEGNTHYFIILEGDDNIYDVLVSEHIDIIRSSVGSDISFEYNEGDSTREVINLN